jgi:hypothetical protein
MVTLRVYPICEYFTVFILAKGYNQKPVLNRENDYINFDYVAKYNQERP